MMISRQQKAEFDQVVQWYGCTEDEVELMRMAYREDPETAAVCFAEIAREAALAVRLGGRAPGAGEQA